MRVYIVLVIKKKGTWKYDLRQKINGMWTLNNYLSFKTNGKDMLDMDIHRLETDFFLSQRNCFEDFIVGGDL